MAVRHTATATLPYLMRGFGKETSTARRSLPSLRRAFSLYDQINLIDQVPEDQLRFQGYTATGFTVNGVDYEGSLLCIGNLLMSWTPKTFSDITPESLSLFKLIRPIPEILILGTGRYVQHVDPEVRRFIRSTGMKLEEIDSESSFTGDCDHPWHLVKTTYLLPNKMHFARKMTGKKTVKLEICSGQKSSSSNRKAAKHSLSMSVLEMKLDELRKELSSAHGGIFVKSGRMKMRC